MANSGATNLAGNATSTVKQVSAAVSLGTASETLLNTGLRNTHSDATLPGNSAASASLAANAPSTHDRVAAAVVLGAATKVQLSTGFRNTASAGSGIADLS